MNITNLEKVDSLWYQMMGQQSIFLITNHIITEQGCQRSGGQGFLQATGYYERGPQLLSKENRGKIDLKEIPSCLILRLLIVP